MHTSAIDRRGFDYIGVSASFIIHDGKGNILLHKRSVKTRDEHGTWDVGGGAIEFDETIEQAVYREVKEELTANPIEIEFLTVYDAFRQMNDIQTHWITIMYTVLVDPDQIKIGEPDKIDAIGWFTSKNLPSPLHSQFWKSYQIALDRGIVK